VLSVVTAAATSEVRRGEEVVGRRARAREEEDGNRKGWGKVRNAVVPPARPQSSSTGRVAGRMALRLSVVCMWEDGCCVRLEAKRMGSVVCGQIKPAPPLATVIKER